MDSKIRVGDVFSEVFATYRNHAGTLLPVAFWLFLAVAILDGIARDSFVLLLVALVVGLIAGTLYKGIVVSLVRDVQDGKRDPSVSGLVSSATPVLGPLLGAGILAGFGITIGFVLLIVPGLILLTIWAVIAPVIVIENRSAMESFGRSRELVRGNGWPVFGTVLLSYLIIVAGSIVFGGIAASIADGPLLRIVFSALAATITAPVDALVAAVLYYRLLAIKGRPTVDPAAPAAPHEP